MLPVTAFVGVGLCALALVFGEWQEVAFSILTTAACGALAVGLVSPVYGSILRRAIAASSKRDREGPLRAATRLAEMALETLSEELALLGLPTGEPMEAAETIRSSLPLLRNQTPSADQARVSYDEVHFEVRELLRLRDELKSLGVIEVAERIEELNQADRNWRRSVKTHDAQPIHFWDRAGTLAARLGDIVVSAEDGLNKPQEA